MLQIVENSLGWHWLNGGLAAIAQVQERVTPEEVSVVFSGPKFLVALLAGVLMAFAFQLLLTNFSVAAGISYIGSDSSSSDDSESLGETIRKVENQVGIWALITSSIALFIACFFAVKLSLIESAFLGSIIGVVIWAAYFSLVVWLGSSTVGSLIGAVASTANSGFKALMGTATSAVGANVAKKQMVSTVEDITAAVRRELTSGFDVSSIQNTLQSSLANLQRPQLDFNDIRSQFDKIFSDVDFDSDLAQNFNRQTFVDLISSRTDFSKADVNKIADQLEGAWKQTVAKRNPAQQVINLLTSATPEELQSDALGDRLQELVTVGGNGNGSNGVLKQAIQSGLSAALPIVLERVNTSNIDVNKITNQLQKLKDKVQDLDIEDITHQIQETVEKTTKARGNSSSSNYRQDVESYIQNSLPWHFNRITIKDEFRDVIYDPQADAATMRRELEGFSQEEFANLLIRRSDISEARVKEISQQMEEIRQEVLETLQQAEVKDKSQDLRNLIENYLRSTDKKELNSEAVERDFSKLLTELNANFEDFNGRLQGFDREVFLQVLMQRQDFSEEEANNLLNQLESVRDSVVNQLEEQARTQTEELRQRVEGYLRNTNKEELNPESIRRDFSTLLQDPQTGFNLLRQRLSQFDRDTLVSLLSQRQDLNEDEVNQILDQLEAVRDNILQTPQVIADKAKEQYEQTTTAIADYLRNTNLEELNPEGIRQDLEKLLVDPKEGFSAIRDRLSQVDRETLVKLVSQRQDLSEEQVQQTIDQAQDAIRDIIKAPRRLAKRGIQRVVDFEANLEDYLRNTNKEELNPDSIKRDLQLLLRDPRAGIGQLSDRFSQVDRSTLVALLSQREDISEEEVNRIADQIESARDGIVKQYQQIQQGIQSATEKVTGRIRNYLNSLNRPELNYEDIKHDFAKVFDDPQAGFEGLRDRLSHFDRDTLVALISSREDISEEDANRIINQIEAARDSVLERAERIQQITKERLHSIKEQAKKQAEETKKTVANAAWWLFGTALTSLVASAIAGAIAVTGVTISAIG
ncbi:MFS transporter [Nostoc sp. FACHB-152]|uniref:MFS transporter n=1 Tax=unclassified Nostoc TaxID=2593658 RepID=UPI001689C056|nr:MULTISPECIES: MFS transporter [unclassified Nostoc]MBD2451816.1 MFS transporter [Nostoc sp. FACHB-152]MBD2472900.1 MFS transporter [Nostoc sp. FACHB-145]